MILQELIWFCLIYRQIQILLKMIYQLAKWVRLSSELIQSMTFYIITGSLCLEITMSPKNRFVGVRYTIIFISIYIYIYIYIKIN